jgi:hypothetical protein
MTYMGHRVRALLATTCLVLATLGLSAPGQAESLGPDLAANGGFEAAADDLGGWVWGTSDAERTGWALDSAVAHAGKASLRLHSELAFAPNTYCGVSQRVTGLAPDTEYVVRLWARGKGVGTCWFGGGPGWAARGSLPTGDFDWTPLEVRWHSPDPAGDFDLRINVDSQTEALWVDDVTFQEVDPLTLAPRVTPMAAPSAARLGYLPLSPLERGLTVDGDLSDWPAEAVATRMPQDAGVVMIDRKGDDDLSATLRAAADAQALYLGITVRDDVHWAAPGAVAWTNDSIQLGIDPLHERTRGGYGPHDCEYSLMLGSDGKPEVQCWVAPEGVGDQSKAITLAVKRSGQDTVYEVAIPWPAIGVKVRGGCPVLGLDVLVNDNDGAGRRGYIELTQGIGKLKDPSQYVTAMGRGPCSVAVLPGRPVAYADDPLDVRAAVVLGSALTAEATVELSALDGKGNATPLTSAALPPGTDGIVRVACRLPAGLLPGTTAQVRARVTGAGGKQMAEGTAPLTVSPARAQLIEMATRLRERTADAVKLAERAEARGIGTDYERVGITVAEMFVGFALEDLANDRRERAEHVLAVIDRTLTDTGRKLEAYLSGKAKPLLVPRYQTGKVEVKRGAFWGDTLVPSTGKRERRPVFFTGVNGWDYAVRDMPQLARMGANFIQIECGPDSTEPAEGMVTDQPVRDRTVKALDLAEQYNVSVCWLAAPHYFPAWALAKWPELLSGSGGFFRLDVDAPQARQILKTHLEVSLRAMGDTPALHSVCLSNEPVFTNWQSDPFRRAAFADYLAGKYGTVAALNAAWSTDYPSFAEVPILATDSLPAEAQMTPLRYEMARLNMLRFSEFHRFMAEVVHETRPGTWACAKVMCVPMNRQNLAWGTDPEQFAHMGDLNGNDCACMFAGLGDRYAVDFLGQGIYYDLQRSMRDVPVVNMEDHIIVDREQRDIPPEHTDLALWQGAIHGRGASAIWVWGRTYDRASDLEGSIMHRPENTMAMGRVALDLQRLAPEVVALQRARAPVAIVYSVTALLWSDAAQEAIVKGYEALNACGVPVRFVSEDQAADGGLEGFAAVIAPALGHTPDSLASALARYCEGGGKVWVVGEAPVCGRDEYGRPRDLTLPASALVRFPASAGGRTLQGLFLAQMQAQGVRRLVTVADPDGKAPWGVEYRAVRDGDAVLVSIANLWGTPQKLSLAVYEQPARSMDDLRRATTTRGAEVTLQPLEATVLRVR